MKTAMILALATLISQIQSPRHDPNGIWEAETGTRFELRLSGQQLHIQLVDGSNPRFLKYEVNLENAGEVNTYKGSGYFIAKLPSGKECRFDTDWQIVVVQTERIIGSTSTVVPDPETCEVKERGDAMIDLKKK